MMSCAVHPRSMRDGRSAMAGRMAHSAAKLFAFLSDEREKVDVSTLDDCI